MVGLFGMGPEGELGWAVRVKAECAELGSEAFRGIGKKTKAKKNGVATFFPSFKSQPDRGVGVGGYSKTKQT